MAHTHKLIDGVRIDLTAEEIAEIEAREQAWEAGAFNRVMADLRQKRNAKLAETDWVVLPDSPVADKTAWQNYRTELRDLTNGLTTVEEVDAVIWPTKPGA
jgi:hypothetical protein